MRIAKECPRAGYTRIVGLLKLLGEKVSRTTVQRVLRKHGIDPAPKRGKYAKWSTFLKAHWEGMAACDFFTVGRAPLYTPRFRDILKSVGVKPVRLPAKSPNLNAYAERFVLSIKTECLDRMVILGERHRRTAVREYMAHYLEERNHQGLENKLICPGETVGSSKGRVACRERLGGMLKYYYRQAA